MFLAATTLAYSLTLGVALAAEPLSVMSFGGAYQDAQRKAVFGAYSEETGRQISELSAFFSEPSRRASG
jgi:putative spermidine/putrescine transport system substrate-binding protein